MSELDDVRALDDLARSLAPDTKGLLTEIHLGIVVSEEADGTCTILLAGDEDDNPISGVRRLRTNTPAGAVVYICRSGADYTIVGALDLGTEWADYVPEVRQPAALTVTPNYCRWWRNRNQMNVEFNVNIGSSGTAANNVLLTLPTPTDAPGPTTPVGPVNHPIGIAQITGFGSGVYGGVTVRLNSVGSSPNVHFVRADINTISGVMGGADPNSALIAGNIIRGTCRYEVA